MAITLTINGEKHKIEEFVDNNGFEKYRLHHKNESVVVSGLVKERFVKKLLRRWVKGEEPRVLTSISFSIPDNPQQLVGEYETDIRKIHKKMVNKSYHNEEYEDYGPNESLQQIDTETYGKTYTYYLTAKKRKLRTELEMVHKDINDVFDREPYKFNFSGIEIRNGRLSRGNIFGYGRPLSQSREEFVDSMS